MGFWRGRWWRRRWRRRWWWRRRRPDAVCELAYMARAHAHVFCHFDQLLARQPLQERPVVIPSLLERLSVLLETQPAQLGRDKLLPGLRKDVHGRGCLAA